MARLPFALCFVFVFSVQSNFIYNLEFPSTVPPAPSRRTAINLRMLRICLTAKTVPTDETFMESYLTPKVNSRRCDAASDYASSQSWFRLTGTGGNKIHNNQVSGPGRCGATWPGWVRGTYPEKLHQIVRRDLCYRSERNTCYGPARVDILKCGEDNFVFRLHQVEGCYLAFCTSHMITAEFSSYESICAQSLTVDTDETFLESYKVEDKIRCDASSKFADGETWFRLRGSGGNKMLNSRISESNRCGAAWPGWVRGTYPVKMHELVVRDLCYRTPGNPCYKKATVEILKCASDDFVYRLHVTKGQSCLMAFCTMSD